MIPSELFEVINGVLSALSLGVLVIFARYFLIEMKVHGFKRTRMGAGIAVTVMSFGEFSTRSWTWAIRYLQNTHGSSEWLSSLPWSLIPIAGALIEAVGLLCMIRVFSPDEWGHSGWEVVAAIAAAAVLASWILR